MSDQESAISLDSGSVEVVSPVSGDVVQDVPSAMPESAAVPEAGVKHSGVPVVRPSGLKPPSKIGRPCAGQQKPALPVPLTPSKQSEFSKWS